METITPIPKNDEYEEAENNRPISILPNHVTKVTYALLSSGRLLDNAHLSFVHVRYGTL